MSVTRLLLSAGLLALSLGAVPAVAQVPDDSRHGDHDDNDGIVVTALLGHKQTDLLSGTSIVSGDELARDLKPTIGETLSHQAGVSATSFGPNASRPVLRGFQGERVRVLSDGIGSFDVSNTSVDHAVVINPLTADRIEVLRGPAALLFGSSAIGGVVNVIDSRIPRKIPSEAVHFDGTALYGSASDERSGAARIDLPVTDKIIVHFDGSYTKSGDLRTGGSLLSPTLRAQALASPDADIRDIGALSGRLPNIGGETWEIAGGAAVITSNGNLGFSVSHYDSLYGVPIRYSLDPDVEAEQVCLDVKQTRVDLRGEVNPTSGFIEAIRLRAGFADYKHNEIDDTGAIGTTFLNQGWEGRSELVQRESGGWRGAIGGQFFLRNLNIIGAEKFLPKSETQQYGLFTLQSIDLGIVRAEAGARVEKSILSAREDATLGNPNIRRNFTAVSGSLGGTIEFIPDWRFGINASYTERAPAAEELFANGPHAGTQAFEIGNTALTKERSKGLEATLRGKGNGYSFSASLYHSWFNNFIFETATGAVVDGLPVFQTSQANARHYGFEVEASAKLATIGSFALNVDGVADATRAQLTSGAKLPRIPALRLLGGLEAQSDTINGRVEVEWVDAQKRVAAFETTTAGYTLVNASLGFKPLGANGGLNITLSANNIFDVVARRHASFLKDYAPLSGRDIRISARISL
jgi:iron complex outermembrane recepter protein